MVALAGHQIDGIIGAVISVLIIFLSIGVAILVELRYQRRQDGRGRASPEYLRSAAEFSIRNIRRQAIREMFEAERQYHDVGRSDDVIESTAVEIKR
jgi:hypothetical protein